MLTDVLRILKAESEESKFIAGERKKSVEHLANAISVCSHPNQLMHVLEQTLPPQVFRMLMHRIPYTMHVGTFQALDRTSWDFNKPVHSLMADATPCRYQPKISLCTEGPRTFTLQRQTVQSHLSWGGKKNSIELD